MSKEIQKRFETRVIPNNWHITENGADEYLKKYGKGISQQKLKELKKYSDENNYKFFSEGLEKHIVSESNIDYMRQLVGKEKEQINDDAQYAYEDGIENGDSVKLVETTLFHLGKIEATHFCGAEDCFKEFTTNNLGHLKVRCCYNTPEHYDDSNTISSCDIYLTEYGQGDIIQEITGLRFEDNGSSSTEFEPNWYYFESE